jgi:CBS domain-containing protein
LSGNTLVRDVMTKNVKTIREDTTLREVIATFSSLDIDSLVVAQSHRPVGIVTAKDALTRGFDQGIPASTITARNVMTTPVETIEPEATVEEAVEKMGRAHIKHLPVVTDGKLVGILSDSDIMLSVPNMISGMEEVCHRQAQSG